MKLIKTYYSLIKENDLFDTESFFKRMVGELVFYKYDYFVFTWGIDGVGMSGTGNVENQINIDLKNSSVSVGKNILDPLINVLELSKEDAEEYVLNLFTKKFLYNNPKTIENIVDAIKYYIRKLDRQRINLELPYNLDAFNMMAGETITQKIVKGEWYPEQITPEDVVKRAQEISNKMIGLVNQKVRSTTESEENINEYLQKNIFNYSLTVSGGYPSIFWSWYIENKPKNINLSDTKPFVFRLKASHSTISHSPHKDDPFFYINNQIVNFISQDLNKPINEVRKILISWFIEKIYGNINFKKSYIIDYLIVMSKHYGLPKKYTKLDIIKRNFKNLKSQTIDKVLLQKKANEFYNNELLNIINGANEQQEYYGSNFPDHINEQTTSSQIGGNMVPSIVYDAIKKIESRYSYMKNGKIIGWTYSGDDKESYFKEYVKNTIGLDNWFKINEKLRGQIYAYAFQADSGDGGMFFRWIAGLANAIDPSIKRLSIVNNKIDDPNVKNAINVIIKACKDGSINSYYENYLKILDQQYKSGDYNNNYKYIWKYRPTAMDRFMKGENENVIFKDWEKSFTETETPNKIIDPNDANF